MGNYKIMHDPKSKVKVIPVEENIFKYEFEKKYVTLARHLLFSMRVLLNVEVLQPRHPEIGVLEKYGVVWYI